MQSKGLVLKKASFFSSLVVPFSDTDSDRLSVFISFSEVVVYSLEWT